jgi:ribosomal protein L17
VRVRSELYPDADVQILEKKVAGRMKRRAGCTNRMTHLQERYGDFSPAVRFSLKHNADNRFIVPAG